MAIQFVTHMLFYLIHGQSASLTQKMDLLNACTQSPYNNFNLEARIKTAMQK